MLKKKLFISSVALLLTIAGCGGEAPTSEVSSIDSSTIDVSSTEDTSSSSSGSESSSSSESEESSSSSEKEESTFIKLYLHDKYGILSGNPYIKTNESDGFVEIKDSFVENEVTYWSIPNKCSVKVKLQDRTPFIAAGVIIDEEYTYSVDENGCVTFDVDTEDDFISMTTLARTNGVELIKNNSDNLSIVFYWSDKTTEIESVGPLETVYVKILGESDEVSVKDLVLTYTLKGQTTKNTRSILESKDSNGFYSFTALECEYGMTLTVTELSLTKFKGAEFVGDYLVLDRSVYKDSIHYFDSISDLSLNVLASGEILYRGASTYIDTYDEYTTYTTGHSTAYYGSGFFIISYPGNGYFGSVFSGSELIGFKKENVTDLDSEYVVNAEQIIVNNNCYMIIEILHNEKQYKFAVIDFTNKEIYFDASVTYYYGENFHDDQVMYTLSDKEGNKIVDVSYQLTGGINNRVGYSYPYGVYQNAELGELILPNQDSAIYKDNEYIWSFDTDNNQAILTNSESKITLSLNQTNGSFTFVSEESVSSNIPNFKGLTFTGKWYNNWDERNTAIKLVFNDYESDNISGELRYGEYPCHAFGFTATYDCDKNLLTFTIVSETYKEGVIGKTFSAFCENGKLTFKSGFNETLYNVVGQSVTNSDFVM